MAGFGSTLANLSEFLRAALGTTSTTINTSVNAASTAIVAAIDGTSNAIVVAAINAASVALQALLSTISATVTAINVTVTAINTTVGTINTAVQNIDTRIAAIVAGTQNLFTKVISGPAYGTQFDECQTAAGAETLVMLSAVENLFYHVKYIVISIDAETRCIIYWRLPGGSSKKIFDLQLTDFGGLALPIPVDHRISSPEAQCELKVEFDTAPANQHSVSVGGHSNSE